MATLEWSPLPRLGPHGLWVPLAAVDAYTVKKAPVFTTHSPAFLNAGVGGVANPCDVSKASEVLYASNQSHNDGQMDGSFCCSNRVVVVVPNQVVPMRK